jgi:dipeptidyl-peptidase-4
MLRTRHAARLAALPAALPAALLAVTAAAQAPTAAPAAAPVADAGRLTVERIFNSAELRPRGAPGVQWMRDGRSYVEARAAQGGTELVRVDAATGAATVLVAAAAMRDAAGRPLEVEEVQLAPDERRALVFGSSVRVWRSNTRGTFHVVDFATRRVTPVATVTTPGKPATGATSATGATARDTVPGQRLGRDNAAALPSFIGRGLASGAVDADLQMFAKFSPDSRKVAYVRGNNLWVTDVATGRATRLTSDGSDDVINGTTDWVYEEELGLRDAFRWSPDSRRLAYWRFDQSAVPAYPVVNETGGVYPQVSVLRYPKAGAPNSRVKVGVVDAGGGTTRWLAAGPDSGQYLARMDWVGADSVAVVRTPRSQDRMDLLMLSAATGAGRTVVTDRDSAYVDVEGEPVTWLAGATHFLLRSDRTGGAPSTCTTAPGATSGRSRPTAPTTSTWPASTARRRRRTSPLRRPPPSSATCSAARWTRALRPRRARA